LGSILEKKGIQINKKIS